MFQYIVKFSDKVCQKKKDIAAILKLVYTD